MKEELANFARRERPCKLCADQSKPVDFKDASFLQHFMSEQGKILARRITGNCPEHQREITLAIKRAREIGLITAST